MQILPIISWFLIGIILGWMLSITFFALYSPERLKKRLDEMLEVVKEINLVRARIEIDRLKLVNDLEKFRKEIVKVKNSVALKLFDHD